MQGALLCSGQRGAFTALGETGQAVYRSAAQIREAIRRKHPSMARHLAIPQSNQAGDRIDWYSSFAGDVVAWRAASEEERAIAREQLESLVAYLGELSRVQLAPHDGASALTGRDAASEENRAVFGKLLSRVVRFPDESYVYLVDGIPVIAFWGFEHPNADPLLRPLHCLYPELAPVLASPAVIPVSAADVPLTAQAAVAPAAPVVVAAVSGMPRWVWWFLAALLIALLLFGLRSCLPWGHPGTSLVAVPVVPRTPVEVPAVALPDLPGRSAGAVAPVVVSVPGAGRVGEGAAVAATGGMLNGTPSMPPDAGGIDAAPKPGALPTTPSSTAGEQTAPQTMPSASPPDVPASVEPASLPPPVVPSASAASLAQAADGLRIPAGSQSGAANFLDGHWRAGAGIQDASNGKPLRLEYAFEDSRGEVKLMRGDGVACSGPVAAAMVEGNLHINSEQQARCGDGTLYDMPRVQCQPTPNGVADCIGNYGETRFPITMRPVGQ
jgi:hypothetical protein